MQAYTVPIVIRSNNIPVGTLTLNGKPLPFMHLNARSRYIMREEILDAYLEDVWRPVTTSVEGPRW